MKKTLVSLFSLSLLGSVHAECDSSTSFSGAFGGLGVVVSFDKDYMIGSEYNVDGELLKEEDGQFAIDTYKKSKTAFGGQIVLGYGHQFENNMYVAIMHESNFLSKAKHELTGNDNQLNEGEYIRTSRKVWTPSFGIAAGYIVDDINFGIRGGISLNKFKFEQHLENSDATAGKEANITITETSPYVGVYVEKKFGDFIGYMNIDHVFKKQKFAHTTKFSNNITANKDHKRPSWKVAVGVKYHLPIF